MKNIFGLTFLLCISACQPTAPTSTESIAALKSNKCINSGNCVAHFSWEASSSDEEISGYRIEYGPISRNDPGFTTPEHALELGKVTEAKLSGLEKKTYYVSIRALSGDSMSDPSEEIELTPPLMKAE